MASELTACWKMSNESNLYLLKGIPPAWLADACSPRTRTVAAQFAHMHAVRLRWLQHAAPDLADGLKPFEKGAQPKKTELAKALRSSEKPVAAFLESCTEAGKVRNWKGPPATFLGYLVAHEAHHRGLAIAALRHCGHKLPKEVVYGLWDWGKRRSLR